MRAVVTRVNSASVTIDGQVHGKIGKGLLVLRGVHRDDTEKEAAIAYNKAADILIKNGFKKAFMQNYIDDCSNKEYAEIYSRVKISDTICNLKASL